LGVSRIESTDAGQGNLVLSGGLIPASSTASREPKKLQRWTQQIKPSPGPRGIAASIATAAIWAPNRLRTIKTGQCVRVCVWSSDYPDRYSCPVSQNTSADGRVGASSLISSASFPAHGARARFPGPGSLPATAPRLPSLARGIVKSRISLHDLSSPIPVHANRSVHDKGRPCSQQPALHFGRHRANKRHASRNITSALLLKAGHLSAALPVRAVFTEVSFLAGPGDLEKPPAPCFIGWSEP
jgi:hypothetical protein